MFHKGIGISVDEEAAELAAHYAADEQAQGLVFGRKAQIGPHLRAGVAQPHGRNVARNDESIVVAVGELAIFDRRVQRIGKAKGEHTRQLGTGQLRLYPADTLLHLGRGKGTTGRPERHIGRSDTAGGINDSKRSHISGRGKGGWCRKGKDGAQRAFKDVSEHNDCIFHKSKKYGPYGHAILHLITNFAHKTICLWPLSTRLSSTWTVLYSTL